MRSYTFIINRVDVKKNELSLVEEHSDDSSDEHFYFSVEAHSLNKALISFKHNLFCFGITAPFSQLYITTNSSGVSTVRRLRSGDMV